LNYNIVFIGSAGGFGVYTDKLSYILETFGGSHPPDQALIFSSKYIKALVHDFF